MYMLNNKETMVARKHLKFFKSDFPDIFLFLRMSLRTSQKNSDLIDVLTRREKPLTVFLWITSIRHGELYFSLKMDWSLSAPWK